MHHEFAPTTHETIKSLINAPCAIGDGANGLPGASAAIIGKDGKLLFSHAAGQKGVENSEALTTDSVFWIASCTKLITGIACMQLVEQGRLSLDDADETERICPELRDLKVLVDRDTLVDKKRGITLRMLLSHTAGFGYSFMNHKLLNYSHPAGYDEFSGDIRDFKQPLVHQPGEAWEYGVNIDWVGVIIERVTKQSLNEYFHKHIFEPLGLTRISMVPTPEMKDNLAYMHQRDMQDKIWPRDHPLRRALQLETKSEVESYFNSGGAGCFSTPEEYCQILAVLLNDGTSPTTGSQILQKETVEEMFSDQVSHLPPLCEKEFQDAKPDLAGPGIGMHPTVEGDRQGWGLTFLLSGGLTGRSVGTAQWSGLPNLFWWCDREKGVAGIVCAQILPFGDKRVFKLYQDVEAAVYKGLSE
ncbi:hypothetical protein N7454_004525 [Penicillium verhagenii]|nr:hypothetical protein N7454_004525 [Penicillium verhagenii]